MEHDDLNETPELLAELQSALPMQVVAAKRGVGSFITLDLAGKAPESTVHIWVYLSDWVIYQHSNEILTSEVVGPQGAALPCFQGRALLGIELDGDARAIDLFFDQDLMLLLSPNLVHFAPTDNLVMFFRPNRRVLAFSHERGFYETD